MISLQQQIFWAARLRKAMTAIAGVAVVGFVTLFYLPDQRTLQSLTAQTAAAQDQLLKNEAAAKDLGAIKRDVTRLKDQITRSRQLPAQQDLPRFIRDVTSLSDSSELLKFRYEPSSKRQQALCSELPISLMFEGRFLNVASFLRQVEEMPRVTRTRSLQIRSRDGATGTVDVQMSVSVFFGEGQ